MPRVSKHDYSPYVGIVYEQPHGCFRLVDRIFRECYGWDVSGLYADLDDANKRIAQLMECIAQYATAVEQPAEGDIVLIQSAPWHVGVAIDSRHMIHQFASGHSAVSNFTMPAWKPRIVGFYRYCP